MPPASLLWSALAAALAVPGESTAVRGGTVVNPDGSRVENAVVVMVDGRITFVGADTAAPAKENEPAKPSVIPADATVYEAAGKTIFPGMILAHTQIGLDVPNENMPVAPFVNVYDAIEPNSLEWEECLRAGISTIHVIQGNNTVITGLSRIVKPLGAMVEYMTVRADYAMKLSITPRSGFNRMTQMAELRRAFGELDQVVKDVAEKRYEEEQTKKGEKTLVPPDEASKEGMKLVRVEELESRWRNLWRLEKGELPLFVHCDRAMDVERGIDFLKEMKLLEKSVFVVGAEAWKVAAALKATGRPVVLSPMLVHKEFDPDTGKEKETFVPKVFADAGIPFVLQPNGFGFTADGQLWYQAARCVREGVARDVALKAITQSAADAIGMGDQLGSIAVGKWGNLAILSGDPLAQTTVVEKLLIEGKPVYDRATDRRVKELTTGQPQPVTEPKQEAAKPDQKPDQKAEDKSDKKEEKKDGQPEKKSDGR